MTFGRLLRVLWPAMVAGCTQTTELLNSGPVCDAPGPAIELGADEDARPSGAIAADLGRHALCTCTPLALSGALSITPLLRHGPVPPGDEPRASLGSDGDLLASGPVFVDGSLDAAGTGGVDLREGGHVSGDLRSGGNLTTDAPLSVTGEVFAAGDVFGQLTMEGPLHVPVGAMVGAGVVSDGVLREPVSVPPPCDCESGPLFDIAAAVEARSAANNNQALPFAIDALEQIEESQTLDLPCGEYYADEIRSTAPDIELRVQGRVGIFVAGDVRLDGNLSVTVEPGGELDLVIAGSLFSTGRVVGGAVAADRVRLWVGSTTVSLPDQIQLGALIYAPSAVLTAGAGLTTTGVLFVGTLSVDGDVRLTAVPHPHPGDGPRALHAGP